MEMWVKQCYKYLRVGMESRTMYIRQMSPCHLLPLVIWLQVLTILSYSPIALKDLHALYLLCDLFFPIFIKASHIILRSAIKKSAKVAEVELESNN